MTSFIERLRRHARSRISAAEERTYVRKSITQKHGPSHVTLNTNDIVLVILGRNISFFIDDLYEYYRAMGVDWVVYLDNDSTDNSVNCMAKHQNTIVATSSANFRTHQNSLREAACTMFTSGGWRLAVDADEIFDYPNSRSVGLRNLVQKLSQRGHTGVVAQMLDMVPYGPLPPEVSQSFEKARSLSISYCLDDIWKTDYHSSDTELAFFTKQNTITNLDTKLYFGGIRKTLFGENCCLTKHPLFRVGRGVRPLRHPHVSTGINCTDFTAVLYHYKFSGDVLKREQALLKEQRISHGETALRVEKLVNDPSISFKLPNSRLNPTADKLLEERFLIATPEAVRMLDL